MLRSEILMFLVHTDSGGHARGHEACNFRHLRLYMGFDFSLHSSTIAHGGIMLFLLQPAVVCFTNALCLQLSNLGVALCNDIVLCYAPTGSRGRARHL
jgi:hypothetical protein